MAALNVIKVVDCFKLYKQIGKGAYGEVYEALDEQN